MTQLPIGFLTFIRMLCIVALLGAAGHGAAQQAPGSALPGTGAPAADVPANKSDPAKSVKPVKKTSTAASKTQGKAPSPAAPDPAASPDFDTLEGTTVRGRRQDDHPNVHSVFEKAFPQSDGSATTESGDAFGNRVECIKDCKVGFDCCKTVKANLLSGPDPKGIGGQ